MRESSRSAFGAALAAVLVVLSGLVLAAHPPADPASRLPDGGDASEYWDVTAVFESGHRFFGRWMITNEGPGSSSAIAIGHLLFPDGKVVPFKNGRQSGRWELSDDGRRIRVASSILDQSGPRGRVEIDKNKDGIRIFLDFALGTRDDAESSPVRGDVGFDLLATDAPVEGSVWVRGMEEPLTVRGRLAVTHAWMDESESKLALRRIEFFAPADALAIYLSDVLTPEGNHERRLVIERRGELLLGTEDFDLRLEPSPNGDGDYPLPVSLRITSAGVEGEIRFGRVLVAHDPMEALPQPFRFLLSLKARPHRVWVDSAYEFRVNDLPVDAAPDGPDDDSASVEGPSASGTGLPVALRGSGIANVSFTNPLPSRMRGDRMRGDRIRGDRVTRSSLRMPGV